MLRWLVFLPLAMALLMRWGVPVVTTRLKAEYGLTLEPYYALLTSVMALVTPMLAGVVIGFLLLDQRDDGTLAALRVTPVSLNGFLAYRIGTPMAASVVMTMICVPLVGLVEVSAAALLVVALVASPIAPFYALMLAAFSDNKVQGFALMKAAGILSWPPVIAYFLPTVWQWAMGIVPLYWPAKVFWMLSAGDSGTADYVAVGLAYQAALVAWLLRRFHRVLER